MALRLTYTDDARVTHANSFWEFHEIILNADTKTGRFEITGFRDQASKTDKAHPIGTKEYVISQKEFDVYFTEAAMAAADKTITTQSILMAKETKDELRAGFTMDAIGVFRNTRGDVVLKEEALESFFVRAVDI